MPEQQSHTNILYSHIKDCKHWSSEAELNCTAEKIEDTRLNFQKLSIFRTAIITACEYFEQAFCGSRAIICDITSAQELLNNPAILHAQIEFKAPGGSTAPEFDREIIKIDLSGKRLSTTAMDEAAAVPNRMQELLFTKFDAALIQAGFTLPLVCSAESRLYLRHALQTLGRLPETSLLYESQGARLLKTSLDFKKRSDVFEVLGQEDFGNSKIRLLAFGTEPVSHSKNKILLMEFDWSSIEARWTYSGTSKLRFELNPMKKTGSLIGAEDHGIRRDPSRHGSYGKEAAA